MGISSFVIVLSLCLASPLAAELALTPGSSLRVVERVPTDELKGVLAPFLQKYLLAALRKAELEGPGEAVTFALEARHALWHEIPPQELKDIQDIDAFEVEISENAVRISGPTMLAAGYGTSYFLEKHLGVTWVMPGDLGVALPAQNSFRLKPGRKRVKPAFVSRTYTGMLYPDPAYRLAFQKSAAGRILQPERHYFTAYDYFKSLRLHLLTHASHTMFNIYPVEKYGTTLPEIYPIKDGKRFIPPDRNAWHPCYTNPKTLEIALAKMTESFEKQKTHCFSLGINDGLRVQCQCADCARASWPTPYFDYVKKVAEQAKRYYPPHLIGVLAYGDVKFPTEGLVLPENVLVLVTGSRLAAWQNSARHLGTYEYAYGTGFWVPNFPLKAMKVNALAYRQLGAKVYHAEVHPVWAFDAPKVFIQSRLLWDPDLDVGAALRKFCDAAFGGGGEPMCRFYRRWAALRDNDPVRDGQMPPTPMHLWRRSAAQFAQCTAEDYAFLASCIHEARKLARLDAEQSPTRHSFGDGAKRLDMVETFFDYRRNLFEMNQLPRQVFRERLPANWRETWTALDDRKAKREALLARMREHPEWFAGASASVDTIVGPDWEGRSSWTLNNDVNSALKTLVFNLVAAGKGGELGELTGELRGYAVPAKTKNLTCRPRATHGWYPDAKFVTMQVSEAGGGIQFKTGRTDQKIEDGVDAGSRKQHYAMGTVGLQATEGHKVLLYDVSLTGWKGSVHIGTVNFALNMGWSPMAIAETFGDAPKTVSLRFLVEPVYPGSDWNKKGTGHDIHFLWQPHADDSALEGACSVAQVMSCFTRNWTFPGFLLWCRRPFWRKCP